MDQNLPHAPAFLDQPGSFEPAPERYNPLKDKGYIAGLILLAVSAGLFIADDKHLFENHVLGRFMLHYLLVWLYMIFLWIDKRLRWWMFGARRQDFPVMLLLLLLWLLSCFALNREVSVFQPSVPWLTTHLVASGIACVAFAWHERMTPPLRWILWFVLAATLVLFLYFTLALLPITMLSVLVFWFFGLPLHAFIPLVISIYLFRILKNAVREGRAERLAVWSGIGLPIGIVVLFAGAWLQLSTRIITSMNAQGTAPDDGLPGWVRVSRELERNWLNARLLKAVAEGNMSGRGMLGEGMWLSGSGVVENDPVLQIAASLAPKPKLNGLDCRKIYAAQYDSRNVMEERLWSGHDLVTTRVQSRVMLDPGHRLSYTEKTLTVAQKTLNNSGSTRTQEAIYTFFLPEGGVATALSLWIDGKEERGILTAKSKAKEAYNTIVGRERRDPAVVFWEEGNQVRVRVFPVTPELPRQFKIGITAPLRVQDQTLVYENVSFDGPSALTASETDSVFFEGNGLFRESPALFKNENNALTFNGLYRHQWALTCAATPLSGTTFSFDGKTYHVTPWYNDNENFRPEVIYLDLNAAWTADDLNAVRSLAKGRVISASTPGGFATLTDQNALQLLRNAQKWRFSLFPYHKIDAPASSLVITKSAAPTPLPSELEGSAFGDGIRHWKGGSLRVFHLGESGNRTAYLRALCERRALFCVSGDLDLLKKHLQSDSYPKNPENARTVALPASNIVISEMDTAAGGKAPDHLFRLFAYNQVMRSWESGAGEEPEALLRLAEQAYVVTPVTSLVTLETKADYERFDIKPTQNLPSLGNAWSGGAGSVPEPHEWALIVLLALGIWLAWRRKMTI